MIETIAHGGERLPTEHHSASLARPLLFAMLENNFAHANVLSLFVCCGGCARSAAAARLGLNLGYPRNQLVLLNRVNKRGQLRVRLISLLFVARYI
jgi:hypothetical protein